MCGLLGWTVSPDAIGTLEHTVIVAMLARSMDARGGHSHGLWNGTHLIKGLGDLVTSDKINMPELARFPYVLGHTRFATVGARTIDNAHPWTFEDNARLLIGAHNGQVSNHWELNGKYNRRLPVDSMHIFQHVIEGRALADVHAYGAITYQEDGVTHLGRFNNGELAVLTTLTGIYWASTDTALKCAAWAAGVSVIKLQCLKQNRLYTLLPEPDGKLIKGGPLHVGSYHEGWSVKGSSFNRGETGTALSPVDRASALLDVTGPDDGTTADDLVYEEHETGPFGDDEGFEDVDGNRINDPFHWSTDAQAAYNEYVANERGAEDDTALVDAYKRNRRARRRAITQKHAGRMD